MKTTKSAESLCREYDAHRAEALRWQGAWSQCLEYFDTAQINTFNEGIDGTSGSLKKMALHKCGILAAQKFAAGLTSHTVPQDANWLAYQEIREGLKDRQDVKEFWAECSTRFMAFLADSNFYQVFSEAAGNLGRIGTCCIFFGEGNKRPFNFQLIQTGNYCIDKDSQGQVNRVWREYLLTPQAALEQFPKMEGKLGATLQAALTSNNPAYQLKKFRFLHYVGPRKDRNPKANGYEGWAWESCYLNLDDKVIVEEGGYRSFPYAVARTRVIEPELYGRSPAMDCIDEVRAASKIRATGIKAAEIAVFPELKVASGHRYPIKRGAMAEIRVAEMDDIQPLITGGRFDVTRVTLDAEVQTVNAFFFVDLFQLLDTLKDRGQMTALEVSQRSAEKLLTIAPLVNRIESEIIRPLALRGLDIMNWLGLLPPAPAGIEPLTFKVVMTNRITQGLRMAQVGDTLQGLQFTQQVAAAFPDFVDNIDSDKLVSQLEDVTFPQKAIRDSREVAEMRQARAQAQQAAQQSALLNQGADTLGKLPPDIRKTLASLTA